MSEPTGDAAIRDLERALAETPDDPRARLRLARALVRAGRAGDALVALDLTLFPDSHFSEARALVDEAWERELSGLELARTIDVEPGLVLWNLALDPGGAILAFSTYRADEAERLERATDLFVHDLALGSRRRIEGHPSPDGRVGTITFGGGFGLAQTDLDQLFVIERRDGRVECTPFDLALAKGPVRPPRDMRAFSLAELSPDGTLVYLQRGAGAVVVRWPGLATLIEIDAVATTVSWADGWLTAHHVRRRGDRLPPVEVWSFDGRRVGGAPSNYSGFGAGFLVDGLKLLDPGTGRSLVLATNTASGVRGGLPSLSSDGRGVRFVLGQVPRRVELDLAARTVGEVPTAAALPEDFGTRLWHPHADVVPLGTATLELRAARGPVGAGPSLVTLGTGLSPRAWSRDGHALVLERRTEVGARLEVWRTPTGRARARGAP